ncbi:trypsin-like serine peptidase [Nonomuraea muscovyensis]|jgi:V8-like Glu-specific endopeptidase|uniref:V8-like Glu-specific endopeptidase n=1 Tax=Nonomuraea muscovyensis TaxID=1124761 RepID=A0A7X0EWY0_9ACTN|nr:hypothetical protein [Nonomuraea muscovyensis]MBB6344794.1 V8-like Glu-specific endopeptidase [Nonomuraea muscovyensis]MDF2706914.1 hypothetical protein [Nonomuraea muscovyensis]
MTLSTPLLAAVPLVAGLMGPALVGATPPQRPVHPPAHADHDPPRARDAGPDAARATRAGQASRPDVVEHVAARGPSDQQRVLGYWTARRMAAALPIDLVGSLPGGGLLGGLTGRAGGPGVPGLSGTTARQASPDRRPAVSRHHSARPQQTTYGARWSTGGAVTRTTGRVFMTMNGVDFVCSASTVKSANRDVVVTAGHCVKDGAGQWADNWTFVPGYRDGGGHPYGRYPARRMFVAGPWSRSADDSYDVGMVVLGTSSGRHVADVVGAQEIAFNQPRGGQAFGFGYPADPPYNGEHLVYCAGRLRADPHGETRDQGLGCDMTAGSSGGPWLSGFDHDTGKGTLTSLSSFKYSDDQRTMYGPYFGEAVKTLFTTAERA